MLTDIFDKFVRTIYADSEYYTKDDFYRWYYSVGTYLVEQEVEESEVIEFLRKYPIDIALAQKHCSELGPSIIAARHWVSHTVPATEEEAFRRLDKMVTLEEKVDAVRKTRDEFAADEHFGLGIWIRNHWIYCFECDDVVVKMRYEKCYAMLEGTQPGDSHYYPVDYISFRFLERYHDHLVSFMSVDSPVIEVHRKPIKCKRCRGKVLNVQYGEPGKEMMEAAEKGEIILGGCCISQESPDYQCSSCGQRYRRMEK